MSNESSLEVPTVREDAIKLAGRLNLELQGLIAARAASHTRTVKIGKAVATKTDDLSRVVSHLSGMFPGDSGSLPLFENKDERDVSMGGQDGHKAEPTSGDAPPAAPRAVKPRGGKKSAKKSSSAKK